MSKSNIQQIEQTGGQLKHIHSSVVIVEDIGLDIDFTDTSIFIFEDNKRECSHLDIFNVGPDKCMIGFDTQASLVDCLDRSTFSFTIHPGKPYNYISLDGRANSISLRTLTGTTANLEIIVW